MSTAERYSRFESIGAHLPPTVQTTRELLESMGRAPGFDLEHITGVRERRVHRGRGGSFEMALAAARDALGHSRHGAAELDAVISVSITRLKDEDDFYFEPSFAGMLARELGANHAIAFDVSNACAGMLTGAYLLDRMIRAGSVRTGMVVSGDHTTLVARTAAREMKDSYDPQFASLSVGDSAVAVVMDRSVDDADRIHYIDLMTCAEYSHLCLGMPSVETEGIALYTDNKQMHKRDRLRLWPAYHGDLLARDQRSFSGEGFDYVVQHQVGTRFIEYVNQTGSQEFDAAMPPSPAVVEEFGNTATTSHFLTLHRHLEAGTVKRGAKFLLVPAASGVVTGACSTTITNIGA